MRGDAEGMHLSLQVSLTAGSTLHITHAHAARTICIHHAALLPCMQGLVKLADFGVAAKLGELEERRDELQQHVVGTPYWMAPEVRTNTGFWVPAAHVHGTPCLHGDGPTNNENCLRWVPLWPCDAVNTDPLFSAILCLPFPSSGH